MKKVSKLLLFIITVLVIFGVNRTYSRLNITVNKDIIFIAKDYNPLIITSTTKLEDNLYKITIQNNNDYDIEFVCEDINFNFSISCAESLVKAKSTIETNVTLAMTEDTDLNNATLNEDGSGYLTKTGIRIIKPYEYPITNPNHVESDFMTIPIEKLTNLKEMITKLASSDTTNFATDHNTNIRYIGPNPNNYVQFNNDLWRIIGVFGNYVKIVRSTYDVAAFDTGGSNNFGNSSIKNSLATYYNNMQNTYQQMVEESPWYIGGSNKWNNPSTITVYENERIGSLVNANIALPYLSDYGYAVGGENRDTCLNKSIISYDCQDNNWMKEFAIATWGGSYFWTINPTNYEAEYGHLVYSAGNCDIATATTEALVYPTLYLKEDIGFISGNGTKEKPYKLKLGDDGSNEESGDITSPKNAVSFVTNLSSTSDHVKVDHSTNYRFVGLSPKNFIRIDGDLWRIVGAFDGKLKIIKNDPISLAFGDSNDYKISTVKTYLNDTFYNSLSTLKSMIVNGNWNIGKVSVWANPTAETLYNKEIATTISEYVGLLTPSDFTYAVDRSDDNFCLNMGTQAWGDYTNNQCYANNWITQYSGGNNSWSMNASSDSDGTSYVTTIYPYGISQETSTTVHRIHPVVYLDENVNLISGSGTEDKPYQIKLDS